MLADTGAGRPGSIYGCGHPDQPDAAHRVQAGVTADRRPDNVGTRVDGSTVSRRSVTLPVIQPVSVPQGPLHVLIDNTGLQVYGAGQWLEASMVQSRAGRGVNCIWRAQWKAQMAMMHTLGEGPRFGLAVGVPSGSILGSAPGPPPPPGRSAPCPVRAGDSRLTRPLWAMSAAATAPSRHKTAD
jgi:hypothetical protein